MYIMTPPDSSCKNALAVKSNYMYIATAANKLNDILHLEAPKALTDSKVYRVTENTEM